MIIYNSYDDTIICCWDILSLIPLLLSSNYFFRGSRHRWIGRYFWHFLLILFQVRHPIDHSCSVPKWILKLMSCVSRLRGVDHIYRHLITQQTKSLKMAYHQETICDLRVLKVSFRLLVLLCFFRWLEHQVVRRNLTSVHRGCWLDCSQR